MLQCSAQFMTSVHELRAFLFLGETYDQYYANKGHLQKNNEFRLMEIQKISYPCWSFIKYYWN